MDVETNAADTVAHSHMPMNLITSTFLLGQIAYRSFVSHNNRKKSSPCPSVFVSHTGVLYFLVEGPTQANQ